MSTTLDGKALFDEQGLAIRVGAWRRAVVERAVSGLDGVVSIDLGRRDREIRQQGVLHAASQTALQSRLAKIEGCADGATHTLVTSDGRTFENLRIDTFEPRETDISGPGVAIGYEIVYTQLGSSV